MLSVLASTGNVIASKATPKTAGRRVQKVYVDSGGHALVEFVPAALEE